MEIKKKFLFKNMKNIIKKYTVLREPFVFTSMTIDLCCMTYLETLNTLIFP